MKSTIRCLTLAALLALAAGPALAYSLQGRVFDADTQLPIAGANVLVNVVVPDSIMFMTTADGSGYYEFPDLPPANEVYVVIGSMPGYTYSYARVDDLGSGDVTFDILLSLEPPPPPPGEPPPDSGSVAGRVLGLDASGALVPLANAMIQLDGSAGTGFAITDAAGRYQTIVGLGTYSARVSAAGHEALDANGIAVDANGVTFDAVLHPATANVPPGGASGLWLGGATPNPVRGPSASVRFALPRAGEVRMGLFDLAGREVRTVLAGWRPAGVHTATIGTAGLASGTYFYRLSAGGESASKAIHVVR